MRRAGYAYRQPYPQFLYRYKMLGGTTWPVWDGQPRGGVKEILHNLGIGDDEYSFGRTKIFIRNPQTVSLGLHFTDGREVENKLYPLSCIKLALHNIATCKSGMLDL